MSRIFISHSQKDLAKAIAIQEWLIDCGWGNIFRASDLKYGLQGGAEWRQTIDSELERAAVVLSLVSPDWLASNWCQAELHRANNLGRPVFGVIIEDVDRAALPNGIVANRQLIDLYGPNDHIAHEITLPEGGEIRPTLSRSGLNHLKRGLKQSGLDEDTFRWPPRDQPNRQPYRGIQHFEVEDAGVFFGRESEIAELLTSIQNLHEAKKSSLFPLMGASGSGKSSFLRAGLLARLGRDDDRFALFPLLRPMRAAVTGNQGLIAALVEFSRSNNGSLSTLDVVEMLRSGHNSAVGWLIDFCRYTDKTLVITVDQGEELLRGDAECHQLIAFLQSVQTSPHIRCCIIISLRSDAYKLLEQETKLSEHQRPFFLPVMQKGMYSRLIVDPVRVLARNRVDGFEIEPELVERLLRDSTDADAKDGLPMLAFTLERIFRFRASSNKMTLADYDRDGGLANVVESAISDALHDRSAALGHYTDWKEQLPLVCNAFIPWLIRVDAETGTVSRRVSSKSEIPSNCHFIIDRMVEARVLTADIDNGARALQRSAAATVEITHEAVIRQWPRLAEWIEEKKVDLKILSEVAAAANLWHANARKKAYLVHFKLRLREATRLLRSDWEARFRELDRRYLEECEHEERRSRSAVYLAVACIIISALAGSSLYVVSKNRSLTESAAKLAISASGRLLEDGRLEEGAVLLLQASKSFNHDNAPAGLKIGLTRFVNAAKQMSIMDQPEGTLWKVRAPGLIIENTAKSTLQFLDASGKSWDTVSVSTSPIVVMQTGLEHRLYLARADGTLEARDIVTGKIVYLTKISGAQGLSDNKVHLTSDGLAYVRLNEGSGNSVTQIVDLSTGRSITLNDDAVEEVLQDTTFRHLLDTEKSSFWVLREEGGPRLVPAKIDAAEREAIVIRNCFFSMANVPPTNLDGITLSDAELGSECLFVQDQAILTKEMWTSAGGRRTDTVVNFHEGAADGNDLDLKEILRSNFAIEFGDGNLTWVDQTSAGFVAAIFNREVFVVKNGDAILRAKFSAGVTWAAFLAPDVLGVVDPATGAIRRYDLSDLGAETSEGEKAHNSDIIEIKADAINTCSDVNPANFTFKMSDQGREIVVKSITINPERSSDRETFILVPGGQIELPKPVLGVPPICVVANRNSKLISVDGDDIDPYRIYNISDLRPGEFADIDYWPIDSKISSLSLQPPNGFITTDYGHTVTQWHQVDGGWVADPRPLLTSDFEITYAELSPSGKTLLTVEDSGQRMMNANLYSLESGTQYWTSIARIYKFLSVSFIDEHSISADLHGIKKTINIPALEPLLERTRALLPSTCDVKNGYTSSNCWPKEFEPF